MDRLCGYPTIERRTTIAGHEYVLVGPADYERLLDDPRVVQRFSEDEFMPYWAEFWPAATLLAEAVWSWGPPACDPPPRVLELGCGLGLVGLVALRRGYRVTLSDYEHDALQFVRESARRNGLPEPATAFVDWRLKYPELRSDRIVAAEVLYERRNLAPIATFLREHLLPGGTAWLVDGNRQTADAFPPEAAAVGLTVREEALSMQPAGAPKPIHGRLFHVAVK